MQTMHDTHEHPSTATSSAVQDSGQTPIPVDAAVLDDLATANHILFDQGVLDAFGHVSVRHPADPQRFLLSRNRAPALVDPGDILQFNLDGTPIDAAGRSVYLERFIHGEIYRARPDVMAVVHSHSPSVVPFSTVAQAPLRALCHVAAFIGTQAPVFEIRDAAGDGTSLLVTNGALGAALARDMNESSLILMRGHGVTVVGDTLRLAVYRAVYAEVNAKTQLQAMQLGPVTFLSEAEVRTATTAVESQAKRAWDLWSIKARQTVAGYR
jgi:HCOMODA/2-hydroxy-3-carboxy-muconic semialdehyde decarboxylase